MFIQKLLWFCQGILELLTKNDTTSIMPQSDRIPITFEKILKPLQLPINNDTWLRINNGLKQTPK